MKALGFNDVRVRHYGETARIELPNHVMASAIEIADSIVEMVTDVGYRYVTLDLAGLRSGNLNNGQLIQQAAQQPIQQTTKE